MESKPKRQRDLVEELGQNRDYKGKGWYGIQRYCVVICGSIEWNTCIEKAG